MKRVWMKICAVVLLLCCGSFAAFIQKPVPPSSEKNFFYDVDGDGRMDAIRICFLGHLSQDYVDSALARLNFEWLSSKGGLNVFSVDHSRFVLDSSDNRCIDVNLKSMQKEFAYWTELTNSALTTSKIGKTRLVMADSTMYPLMMRDAMAPTVVDNFLRCHRDNSPDTLYVNFSERVRYRGTCPAVLEMWFSEDSSIHVLQPSTTSWMSNGTKIMMVFDSTQFYGHRVSLQDSIRAIGCAVDSSGNSATGKAPMKKVDGFFPLEIYTSDLVHADMDALPADSLFQLEFKSDEFPLPNEDVWGVAIDVFGMGFEKAVREALAIKDQKALNRSDFMFKMGLMLYSNSGSFIASTNVSVNGGDSRFVREPTRLFLKWNLMDSQHRKVGTGAYIAHVSATILYKNNVVFRDSWQKDVSSFTFGVMRR